MKFIKKVLFALLAFVSVAIAPLPAFAAGPDFTTLTSQIDLSTTIDAVMAIGVAAMGLLIAVKGVKYVWRMFKGV
jgi:hypothetical protein